MAVHHGLLGRMQVIPRDCGRDDQRVLVNVLHGPQRQAVDGVGQAYAAVDGRQAQLFAAACACLSLADDHGAGAAIALAAAFLGARAGQVFPQQFEQGPVGRHVVHRHYLAAAQKSESLCWHGSLSEAEALGTIVIKTWMCQGHFHEGSAWVGLDLHRL